MGNSKISPLADPNTGAHITSTSWEVLSWRLFSTVARIPARAFRVELGEDDLIFIHVTCVVCARGHLVNPKTGRVPGAGEDTIGA